MRLLDSFGPSHLHAILGLIGSIATVPLQAQVHHQAQLPRLEAADSCPMALADSLLPTVQCGWLVVPQHWDSNDGRVLRIPYAVARATDPTSGQEPIMYLEGGPSASLDDVSYMLRTSPWMELRKERDLVFTDQRGTGYSTPRLCRSLDNVLRSTELLLRAEDEANARIAGTAAACADSMAAAGLDPAAVNADAIARDVDALRRLLGHRRWNLYGVSYGGRVAEMLMRRAPSSIRSVVLDSPSPAGVPRTTLRALDEALEAVFSQCAADTACALEYPELAQDFDRLMERLESEDLVVPYPAARGSGADTFRINRSVALAAIQRGLYGEQLAPVLPLIISRAAAGHDGALLGLKPIIDRPWRQALDMGAGLAAYCVENPAADPAISARERGLHPRTAAPLWTSTRLPALCDSLHAERDVPPPAAPGSAMGIPVLILGGGHDSSVAPSQIRRLAANMDGSTFVFVPGLGHGLASRTSCTRDLVASFFVDPGQRLDTDCVAEHGSIPFVTDVHYVSGMSRFGTWIVLAGGQARISWLLVSLLVLASPALLWPVLWVGRRIRGVRIHRSAGERRATWLVLAAGFTGVGFMVALASTVNQTLRTDAAILSAGAVVGPGTVFLVPWLLTILTAALLATSLWAWRYGYWRRWRRIHYSLASAAGASALLFIAYWGLF